MIYSTAHHPIPYPFQRQDLPRFPTKKWALSSGLDYTFYSAEAFAERRSVPIWKAGITRYFLKNNKGQLQLNVYDLLNRNVGIQRSSQFNYLEEERIVSLGRYAMLTFAYGIAGFTQEKKGHGNSHYALKNTKNNPPKATTNLYKSINLAA